MDRASAVVSSSTKVDLVTGIYKYSPNKMESTFVCPASCQKRPLSDSSNVTNQNLAKCYGPVVTPTKPVDLKPQEPLTPTANLKLLFSVASPEIRNRDIKKKQLFDENSLDSFSTEGAASSSASKSEDHEEAGLVELDFDENAFVALVGDGMLKSTRKEKSLGLLCQRYATVKVS